MYSRNFIPDINLAKKIVDKLNGIFDCYDMYHHSSAPTEMFEFTYKLDKSKRECWQITFLGKTVASGGGFGLDYDDCFEDEYLYFCEENKEEIFNQAHNGACGIITDLLKMVSYSDISLDIKKEWINQINIGINKINEDKQDENHKWANNDEI